MSNYLTLLPKTTVLVKTSAKLLGSGVLVVIEHNFYVITAAHVVFGKKFQNSGIDFNSLEFSSEEYGKLSFINVVGNFEDQKKNDLIPIKVSLSKAEDYPKIGFCADVSYPESEYIFRGKAEKAMDIHSVPSCTIDTQPNDKGSFHLRVPSDSYSNARGEDGAEILQGYSGSGIFSQSADQFLLVGIVLSVREDNFKGVICCSISILKEVFFPSLIVEDFHGGNSNLRISVSEIRKEITKNLIDERKDISRHGDVENIIRKMDVFLPSWNTEDLDQFIKDILVWEKIYHDRIRVHDEYRELIDEAKADWAAGNKTFTVTNSGAGNVRFHKITDEFKDTLLEILESSPLRKNSRTIVSGEIAKMLADCTLNFRFHNDN